MIGLWMSLVVGAQAETPAEVIERARAANKVDSALETVRMTIVSKGGSSRVREIELRSRRTADAANTYMRFTSPSDVAGMQFLQIDRSAGTDETLVYMPAQKKVMMIGASQQSGSFAGSDFTYEDLSIRDALTGTHTMVEDTAEHWVIDTVLQGSSYTKVRSTVNKSDLVARKVEFFDATGPIKVLEIKRTEKDGTVTLPVSSEMSDLRRGTKTTLEILTHQLNVPVAEETFTRAYLERG